MPEQASTSGVDLLSSWSNDKTSTPAVRKLMSPKVPMTPNANSASAVSANEKKIVPKPSSNQGARPVSRGSRAVGGASDILSLQSVQQQSGQSVKSEVVAKVTVAKPLSRPLSSRTDSSSTHVPLKPTIPGVKYSDTSESKKVPGDASCGISGRRVRSILTNPAGNAFPQSSAAKQAKPGTPTPPHADQAPSEGHLRKRTDAQSGEDDAEENQLIPTAEWKRAFLASLHRKGSVNTFGPPPDPTIRMHSIAGTGLSFSERSAIKSPRAALLADTTKHLLPEAKTVPSLQFHTDHLPPTAPVHSSLTNKHENGNAEAPVPPTAKEFAMPRVPGATQAKFHRNQSALQSARVRGKHANRNQQQYGLVKKQPGLVAENSNTDTIHMKVAISRTDSRPQTTGRSARPQHPHPEFANDAFSRIVSTAPSNVSDTKGHQKRRKHHDVRKLHSSKVDELEGIIAENHCDNNNEHKLHSQLGLEEHDTENKAAVLLEFGTVVISSNGAKWKLTPTGWKFVPPVQQQDLSDERLNITTSSSAAGADFGSSSRKFTKWDSPQRVLHLGGNQNLQLSSSPRRVTRTRKQGRYIGKAARDAATMETLDKAKSAAEDISKKYKHLFGKTESSSKVEKQLLSEHGDLAHDSSSSDETSDSEDEEWINSHLLLTGKAFNEVYIPVDDVQDSVDQVPSVVSLMKSALRRVSDVQAGMGGVTISNQVLETQAIDRGFIRNDEQFLRNFPHHSLHQNGAITLPSGKIANTTKDMVDRRRAFCSLYQEPLSLADTFDWANDFMEVLMKVEDDSFSRLDGFTSKGMLLSCKLAELSHSLPPPSSLAASPSPIRAVVVCAALEVWAKQCESYSVAVQHILDAVFACIFAGYNPGPSAKSMMKHFWKRVQPAAEKASYPMNSVLVGRHSPVESSHTSIAKSEKVTSNMVPLSTSGQTQDMVLSSNTLTASLNDMQPVSEHAYDEPENGMISSAESNPKGTMPSPKGFAYGSTLDPVAEGGESMIGGDSPAIGPTSLSHTIAAENSISQDLSFSHEKVSHDGGGEISSASRQSAAVISHSNNDSDVEEEVEELSAMSPKFALAQLEKFAEEAADGDDLDWGSESGRVAEEDMPARRRPTSGSSYQRPASAASDNSVNVRELAQRHGLSPGPDSWEMASVSSSLSMGSRPLGSSRPGTARSQLRSASSRKSKMFVDLPESTCPTAGLPFFLDNMRLRAANKKLALMLSKVQQHLNQHRLQTLKKYEHVVQGLQAKGSSFSRKSIFESWKGVVKKKKFHSRAIRKMQNKVTPMLIAFERWKRYGVMGAKERTQKQLDSLRAETNAWQLEADLFETRRQNGELIERVAALEQALESSMGQIVSLKQQVNGLSKQTVVRM